MEFIGYVYNIGELKSILDNVPDYYTLVVNTSGHNINPEVYYDESWQTIIIK